MNRDEIESAITDNRRKCNAALWRNDMAAALLHVSVIAGLQISLRLMRNGPERCAAPPPSFNKFA